MIMSEANGLLLVMCVCRFKWSRKFNFLQADGGPGGLGYPLGPGGLGGPGGPR